MSWVLEVLSGTLRDVCLLVYVALYGGVVMLDFFKRITGGSLFFEPFYQAINLTMPFGNTIWFCIGCGCCHQLPFEVTDKDYDNVNYFFYERPFISPDAAHDERLAIAQTINYLEEVFSLNGQHSDCHEFQINFRNAANHTSIVLWLARNGYLKHHIIAAPVSIWEWWAWWKPARALACVLELATMRRYFITPDDGACLKRGVSIDVEGS